MSRRTNYRRRLENSVVDVLSTGPWPAQTRIVAGQEGEHRATTNWTSLLRSACRERHAGDSARRAYNGRQQNGSMPVTPATRALRAAKISFTEHVYDHDPSVTDYGQEAAAALGVSADRVFKTLVVDSDAGLAVVVVPVAMMMDLKAVAAALGVKKAALAQTADAQRSSGYVVGGISPFGQRRALPTVLDQSATGFASILVSGGRRGFDIEVAAQDLVTLLDALVAPVAR